MTDETTHKLRTSLTWGLCGLVSIGFAVAGGNKLAYPAAAGEGFVRFGLPAALAPLIGACEVAGAIGLLIPRLSTWAASGLALIMLGASYHHLSNDPASAAVPALVLGALCATIAVLRRPQAMFLSPQ